MNKAPTWIFDLDNTLYSADLNLFPQIDVRMGEYIQNLLDVDAVEARRVQKDYLREYGTSLRGLMERHGVDPADFMTFVHDIDVSVLSPDPALGARLAGLPGKKFVFTNGSICHAGRVLGQLGLEAHFDGVFDVADADYVPKPERAAYEAFLGHFDLNPEGAIMVEDMARNLMVPADMGMTTVWINTGCPWGRLDHNAEYIHHETEDLKVWLDSWGKQDAAE